MLNALGRRVCDHRQRPPRPIRSPRAEANVKAAKIQRSGSQSQGHDPGPLRRRLAARVWYVKPLTLAFDAFLYLAPVHRDLRWRGDSDAHLTSPDVDDLDYDAVANMDLFVDFSA